jgi:hypothetical protein
MPIKTRRPTRLNIDDFISFMRQLLLWLAGQVGDPDYRAVLVDGLQAKFDALAAKFLEYKQLKIHVPEKNELYTDAAKELHKGLSMLKGLLPSFFDDPDIHGFFGLAKPIPTDLDELYSTGQICFDQWATVSGEPEYVPVVPDFADVLVLFNDFVIKRDEYEAKFQAMQAAQNDMETLRAEIEEQERDLFNYYRSKHPKGDDAWWTETPWGGTGESEPEQLPAVTGLALDYDDPNLTVTWDEVDGADGYKLMMGNNPTILTTTLYGGPETRYIFDPPGGHHYFRVWAMKGDDLGARGDYVEIEIEGVPPAVPKQLKVTREGGYLKWEWKSGGDVPQYYRLYIAIVATGSPAPSRPAEPDVDELITLFVSTFAPGPGNTVYGWVTAFGDGAESDAVGPVGIDVL